MNFFKKIRYFFKNYSAWISALKNVKNVYLTTMKRTSVIIGRIIKINLQEFSFFANSKLFQVLKEKYRSLFRWIFYICARVFFKWKYKVHCCWIVEQQWNGMNAKIYDHKRAYFSFFNFHVFCSASIHLLPFSLSLSLHPVHVSNSANMKKLLLVNKRRMNKSNTKNVEKGKN